MKVLFFLFACTQIAYGGKIQFFRERLLDPNTLTGSEDRSKAPRLFDFNKGEPVVVKKGPFLANRVYAVYSEAQQAWYPVLTNFEGKFPLPLEVLYYGSILPGRFLGAKNPYQNYQLNRDYRWTETAELEKHLLLVLSEPQVFKKETYLTSYWEPPKK